jgi:hypothetical protein
MFLPARWALGGPAPVSRAMGGIIPAATPVHGPVRSEPWMNDRYL